MRKLSFLVCVQFLLICLFSNSVIASATEIQNDNKMYFVATIFLDGKGALATTQEEMLKMRSQLASIDSNLHVTWAITDDFFFDDACIPKMELVKKFVDNYGDEIGIGEGFPNNKYNLTDFVARMNEWMYMYRYTTFKELHVGGTTGDQSVFKSIPDKYKPKSFTSYAINQEQARWVKDNFNIKAFMGWTATQYNVDQLSGEGSPLMPYWVHTNSSLVPAQDKATNNGTISINSITVDPIGCTGISGESRWTIHPADPLRTQGQEQIYTLEQYMKNPYNSKNTINYMSLFIDINWILRDKNINDNWTNIVSHLSSRKGLSIVGINEFMNKWEAVAGENNDKAEFTLEFKGSGLSVDQYTSSSDITYLWTETKTERIILKKDKINTDWKVIDFTDYSRSIPVLKYTTKGREENVSFVTGRNFKLSPDYPLTAEEKTRITKRLSNIGFQGSVSDLK